MIVPSPGNGSTCKLPEAPPMPKTATPDLPAARKRSRASA